MSDITIGAITLANTHNYPTTPGAIKLRIWFTGCAGTNFKDSLNNIVMCGSGSSNFFVEVPVTISGTDLSIPSYVLPSTDDSSMISVLAHAQFYVGGAARDFLFQNWIITNTLGASIAYAALFDYNEMAKTSFASGTAQFLAAVSGLIATAVGLLNKATTAIFGLVRMSVASLNPADPVAVSFDDLSYTQLRLIDATKAPYSVLKNGTAQSTTALQNALNAARDSAGEYCGVYLPPGNYKFTSGSLTLPQGIALVGASPGTFGHTWIYNGAGQPDATDGKVTTIQVDVGAGLSTPPFITAYANSAIKELVFYYPSQSRTAATPTQYPPTIFLGESSSQTHFDQLVENCEFIGAWQAVKVRYGGRFTLRHLGGFPVHGIDVDKSYDTAWIESVKFNAYWYSSKDSTPPADNYFKYVNQNGVAFKSGRVDNLINLNCYVLGYWKGWETVTTSAEGALPGGDSWLTVQGGGAEGCLYGAYLNSAQVTGVIFTGGWRASDTYDSTGAGLGNGIVIASTFPAIGNTRIIGCIFNDTVANPQDTNITIAGGGQHLIVGNRFYQADVDNILINSVVGLPSNVHIASNTFNTSDGFCINKTGFASVVSSGNNFIQKNRADALFDSGNGKFTSLGDAFLDFAGMGIAGANGALLDQTTGQWTFPVNTSLGNGINTMTQELQAIGSATQGFGTLAINARYNRTTIQWNRLNTAAEAWLILAETNTSNTGAFYVRYAQSGANPIVWTDVFRLDGAKSVLFDKGTATAVAGAATLNKVSGTITSEALTTAAGADYVLTLTSASILAASLVMVSVANGTNTTEGLSVQRVTPAAGSVVIRIRNTHAATALNGTIKISYVVF